MSEVLETERVGIFSYPLELEQYQHEGVIGKFRDEWDVDEEEAHDIFSEMKKFLFISHYAQQCCVEFEIDEPILMIDKMWHHFILFTADYEKFCRQHFGKMLHHVPFCAAHLAQKVKRLAQNGVTLKDNKVERLERQLAMIADTFGVETIRKWYVKYANRYTPQKVNALQRAAFHGEFNTLSLPMDIRTSESLPTQDLIQGIVRQVAPSMFCGGSGCGMYCTCNSRGHIYT